MALVLVDLDAAGKRIGTITPVPPEAGAVDALMKKIAAETPLMTSEVARGIDNVEAGLISSAGARMTKISGWTQEATTEIRTMLTPGSTQPASADHPTLRRGATGPGVEELQRRLNKWIATTPSAGLQPLPVNGSFGPKTEEVVKAFQAASGLESDGVAGAKTWEKLPAE